MKQNTNLSVKNFIFILVLSSFIISSFLNAQEKNNDIIIGKTITIKSKILNEKRNIFVYTPAGYDRTQDKYPVLYVLDGEGNFFYSAAVVNFLSRSGRMPRTIVIGIPNTERMRDFTPSIDKQTANSGGADNFLTFLQDELIPFIDQTYRTHSYRTLCGHSLCGMFAIYSLFTTSDLFNSYIAISPYLMYDDEYVIKRVETVLEGQSNFNKHLFITIGNEAAYTNSLNKISTLLKEKTKGLEWKLSKRESEDHGSVPLKSLYDGLEFIYSDWKVPAKIAEKGIEEINKHYQSLSEKYGYLITISEATANILGYQFMGQGKIEKAIAAFKYNVEKHPNSANVYDSLGEGFETNKQFELALKNYEKAVKLGDKNADPNTPVYIEHIERVQKKMKE